MHSISSVRLVVQCEWIVRSESWVSDWIELCEWTGCVSGLGVSEHGVSEHGVSVHGVSVHGVSEHGVSEHGVLAG